MDHRAHFAQPRFRNGQRAAHLLGVADIGLGNLHGAAQRLEPLHCQKRKLTRDIAVAEAERDTEKVKALRAEFAKLGLDKQAAAMEKRLLQLEPRIVDKEGKARRPEDLDAISLQRRTRR